MTEDLEKLVLERTEKLSRAQKGILNILEDLQEAKVALEKSRQSFLSIVEKSADGIIVVDHNGTVCFINPSAAHIFRVNKEEFVGSSFGIPVIEGEMKEIGIIRQSGETGMGEMRSGQTEWEGRDAYLVLVRDITERKLVEEALRESEQRYRALFESTLDGVFVIDAETMKVVLANKAVANIFGFDSVKETIGINPLDFIAPEDRDRVIRIIAEDMFAKDLRQVNEFRAITRDNREIWIRAVGTRIEYQGRLAGLVSFSDITEHKRSEEALRYERLLLRTLIDNVPDSIYTKDTACRKTLANLADVRDMGAKSEAEVLGKDDFEFYPKELAERFFADDQSILQTGQPAINREEYVLDEKGQKRWLLTSKLPLRDEKGQIIGLVGIGRDITDRKQAEDTLRQTARELQERNDELARFNYTVSHDLKSPLVTVKTFIEYFEQDVRNQDTERKDKDLAYIHSAVDKMSRMLDELLEFSHIGRKMNPPEEAPLQEIVKEALDMVAGRITERHVKIKVTKKPILLYGDRQRLVGVFQNLIDNAVKFMGDQQKPRIEIGVDSESDPPAIYVRDNGIGIDPRHLPKLFGLFEKLDPGSEGTGIGLALVRRIIEVHGGKIIAESAGIGKGTTFRFTLAGTKTSPLKTRRTLR